MQKRSIGKLEVSVVGLGCNNFGGRIDEAASRQVIDAAIDAGITLFDTADVYGGTKSEEFMGRALGSRRDRVVIATKFGAAVDETHKGAAPAYVKQAVEASLGRLQTDRIDLYQLHVPDAEVPIADTLGALDDLVKEGKVLEIGASNFSVEQIDEAEKAVKIGAARFVSLQNHYSMLHRDPEAGVLAKCETLGIGFLPYFPLASGMLSGKYRKGQPLPEGTRIDASGRFSNLLTDANFDIVERLIAFSEARGHSILELAFAWLLSRPAVSSVIAGATKPSQIAANVASADWELSPSDLEEVDRILGP
jgi:aryl-alcohol dehydrogenase-like predicted oxidoreductase